MAETIGQYQVSTYTTPANNAALSSSVVRGNLNTGGTAHNSHDADAGIHVQSSVLASRPAAGTTGRKWLTSDGLRLYYDTGSVWSEIAYLSLAAGGTVAGAVTLSAAGTALAVTNNATIGGTLAVTGLVTGSISGNAGTATALQTARTIWGQSFNGTANVAGALSGATTGAFSSDVTVGGTLAVTGGVALSSTLAVTGNIAAGTTTVGANANVTASSYGNNGLFQSIGTDGLAKFQAGALGAARAFVLANTGCSLELYSNATERVRIHSSGGVSFFDATDPGAGAVRVAGTLAVTGAATLNGNVTLGDATADTVTVTGRLGSGLTWATDNTNDIGASGANRPRDVFVGRNVAIGGTLDVTGLVTFSDGMSSASVFSSGGISAVGVVTSAGTTGAPAGGSAVVGVQISSVANFGIFMGSGAPTLSAAQGSLYLRTDGSSTSTRLYVNTNGSTGWTNFTSAT